MKRELKSIALFIALCTFTYLLCAFYATSLNINAFPEGTRVFGVCMFIASIIILAIHFEEIGKK